MVRGFNAARSQPPNVAIKMQTYRQFVDFSNPIPKSLLLSTKKDILSPNEEQKREKHSSDLRFRFGKQAGVFRIAHELICKSLPSIMYVFRDYSTF